MINAVIVQVKFGENHMSGNATNQELRPRSKGFSRNEILIIRIFLRDI